MLLDARAPEKPGGVLVDHGTGKAIRFARKFDTDTGQWEAFAVAPDGESILCTEDHKPIVIRGRAVGRLELVPLEKAHVFGLKDKPELKHSPIRPMDASQKRDGLEQYKALYVKVWNEMRGESRRCVDDRWEAFLRTSDFMDDFILRRFVPVK